MQTLSLVVQPDIALGQVDRQFSGFRPGFRGQQLAPIPSQLQKNNLIKDQLKKTSLWFFILFECVHFDDQKYYCLLKLTDLVMLLVYQNQKRAWD